MSKKHSAALEHILVVVLAFILMGIVAVLTVNVSFLNPISRAYSNLSFSDMYFQIMRHGVEPDTSDIVTIVDMTELHKRGDLAELLTNIDDMNPSAVGVDIMFEGLKDDSIGNELLLEAVDGMQSKTVFANKLTDYNPEKGCFTNVVRSFFADSISLVEGYTNLTDNLEKNTIRNYTTAQQLNDVKAYSFPYAIAKAFDNSVTDPSGNPYIDYGNYVFRIVKAEELDEYEEDITGHIILVGAANEEADTHRAPTGKISGAEIQAYSLETILQRKDIHDAPAWISWTIAVILCLLFELFFQAIVNYFSRHNKNMFLVFLQKSTILTTIILAVGLTIANWIGYIVFKHCHVYIDATLILSLLALVVIARFYYAGIIAALSTKTKNTFVQNSIFK